MVRLVSATALALTIALPLVPAAAQAGSSSGTMAVLLTVEPACAVEAHPMIFVGRAGRPLTAEAAIAVRCTIDTPVAVTLDGGSNNNGSQRYLAGAGGEVPYAIFSDAGRTQLWLPNAAHDASVAVEAPLRLVAYGAIAAPDTLIARGHYSDSVAVRIDF